MQRKSIHIEGIVQGVGFRPFVFQLARRYGIGGWVRNDSRGVQIEAEGAKAAIDGFLTALQNEKPPLAVISHFSMNDLDLAGDTQFVIRPSAELQEKTAQVAPDTYVCEDCLTELFAPADRRYRYPFINCTHCGPRFTIVTGIPYDRPKTTMVDFPMCPACRDEYENPLSRRFHAQPNACPQCGPQLSLLTSDGRPLAGEPVAATIRLLKEGKILAVKGLGGYHLAVDAENDQAVAELRRRKARDEKPFALMARGMEEVHRFARVEAIEEDLLQSPARPIVLLPQRGDHGLSPSVAPRNRFFGVMLPYTPLHYLLLAGSFQALVMTSANISDEPIVYEDGDALQRLSAIADAYLVHDRRIHIRTDDSIVRLMDGRPVIMRRSRGYVPRGIGLSREQPPVLAVGAELKNALCLTNRDRAFLTQHIGDLKNLEVYASLERTAAHFQEIFNLTPAIIAHDLHPDYLSTRYAEEQAGMERIAVQHHHAHFASCLAENGWEEPAIGVIFDGIGYGHDGHIWGGEFLVGDFQNVRRAGHFAYLPMPGGDAATREPWRMALSALIHAYGDDIPTLAALDTVAEKDRRLLRQIISRRINSPLTSSCGRLFDAVASLAGIRQFVSYEGQAALELEQMITNKRNDRAYPFEILDHESLLIFDPASMIRAVVADVQSGKGAGEISRRFHNGLAEMIREICLQIRETCDLSAVALSGGVFQNRYLTEISLSLLKQAGFRVFSHSQVPPNDGGLALGQAVIAGRKNLPSEGFS